MLLFAAVRSGIQPLLPVSPSPKVIYGNFVLEARIAELRDTTSWPGTLALLARNAALLVFGVVVARDAFGSESSNS